MPIHFRLDKTNCYIVQKRVSEITKAIQKVHGKKNCGIINTNTKILHYTAMYLLLQKYCDSNMITF